MKTIMTSHEVVKFGPVEESYPKDVVCDHLPSVERNAFKNCPLGIDFYNELLNDLKDVSTSVEYNSIINYATADLVFDVGCVYESLVDDNDVRPTEDDPLNPTWKLADKFDTDVNNELYHFGLKYYISSEVAVATIRFVAYKAGGKGLMFAKEADNSGVASVSHTDFNSFKRGLVDNSNAKLESMIDWAKERHSLDKSFDTIFKDDECADVCTTKRRRKLYI